MMLAMSADQPLSRRLVLTSGLVVAVGTLTGCSVRLERDAPRVPGIPTQAPPADTPAFQALVDQLSGTIAALDGQSHPWAARLRSLHQQQQSALLAVGASAGMPLTAPTASQTPSAPVDTRTPTLPPALDSPPSARPTASPSTEPMSSAAPVEAAGVAGAAVRRALAVSTPNRPMFLAVAATQATAAGLLGGAVAWPLGSLPAQVAASLVEDVRAAVFGMEVVAARTPVKDRDLVSRSLATMYAARSRVEAAAGAAAAPASNDYELPVRPTDAAAMQQLVQQLAANVVSGCAAQSLGPREVSPATALLHLWSDACSVLWTWGGTPAPFPGTT